MGATRIVSVSGNDEVKPKEGNEITIQYTVYLYDGPKASDEPKTSRGKK